MTKTAIFMGAGASKPFGHLLTRELLPQIKEELRTGELFKDDSPRPFISEESCAARRKALKEYLDLLMPGFDAADSGLPDWVRPGEMELPLITDVLSLLDYSLSVSNSALTARSFEDQLLSSSSTDGKGFSSLLTSRSAEHLIKFRTLLEQAIFDTLVRPYHQDAAEKQEHAGALDAFAEWIQSQAGDRDRPLGIISTNYDIAVERKLLKRHRPTVPADFDFGFSWRDAHMDAIYKRPERPLFQLFKLHGSLNWLRCELCEQVYINTHGSIAINAFRDDVDDANTCYCGHAPLRTVLVAPSFVRDIRDTNLLAVWKNTLELLRTADHWIIIGYSFPPEDIAIRSLFMRAYQGRWRKSGNKWTWKQPRITVVQHGQSTSTFSRYRMFFPDCDYHTGGLVEFLSEYRPD